MPPAHLAAEHDQARVEHDADRGDPDRDPLREVVKERGGFGGGRGHGGLDRLAGRRGRESVAGREVAHRGAAAPATASRRWPGA